MRIQWLRRTAVKIGLIGAVMLTLTSCGGGGVSGDTGLTQGSLSILPGTGSLYAGIPFTFTIAGGRKPYLITSNEQTLIPLTNFTLNGNSFTVVPNNPGVINVGLTPEEVPFRTVTLTVRDNLGETITAQYSVLQNFLTGYNVSIASISSCGVASATTTVAACAGFESLVSIRPTTDGLLRVNKQIRLSNLIGAFGFIDAAGNLVSSVTVTTDFNGDASARLFAFNNAFTQFATMRVTDVQSGAYRDVDFVILSTPISALAVIPTSISVTGQTTLQCGSGQSNIIVTGGLPPYTATSTQPTGFTVAPQSISSSGGSFTVTVLGGVPPNCPTGFIVITDSAGQTVSVSITSVAGTVVPTQPLTVAPNSVCLSDDATAPTATITVTGGNASKVLNSSNSAKVTVTPTVGTGNFTATLNRVGVATPPTGENIAVNVSDGGSTFTVSVIRKLTCP